MAVIGDIFSKRAARESGKNFPDVWQYTKLPTNLREQLKLILAEAVGPGRPSDSYQSSVYRQFVALLRREYGVQGLGPRRGPETYAYGELCSVLESDPDINHTLDIMEMVLALEPESDVHRIRSAEQKTLRDEFNYRMREGGVGFQFESGRILRLDSAVLHDEVLRPALFLLTDPIYAAAEREFLSAHSHYRAGAFDEAITDCGKSLESVMKVICGKRGWTCEAKDTAKRLLEICKDNGLFPSFLLSHYTALASTIESGVPVIRNKVGGHGGGESIVEVPEHWVSYQLYLTATTITFLVECEMSLG